MRKLLVTALAVFALGVGFGLTTNQASAAKPGGGGSSNCYYYCTCAGQPMKCCVYGGQVYCFPTDEFQCTQGYNC